jgi:hypothetical protein
VGRPCRVNKASSNLKPSAALFGRHGAALLDRHLHGQEAAVWHEGGLAGGAALTRDSDPTEVTGHEQGQFQGGRRQADALLLLGCRTPMPAVRGHWCPVRTPAGGETPPRGGGNVGQVARRRKRRLRAAAGPLSRPPRIGDSDPGGRGSSAIHGERQQSKAPAGLPPRADRGPADMPVAASGRGLEGRIRPPRMDYLRPERPPLRAPGRPGWGRQGLKGQGRIVPTGASGDTVRRDGRAGAASPPSPPGPKWSESRSAGGPRLLQINYFHDS